MLRFRRRSPFPVRPDATLGTYAVRRDRSVPTSPYLALMGGEVWSDEAKSSGRPDRRVDDRT